MFKIIICGHGEFSKGILSASKMIFGEPENLEVITFDQSEGLEDLKDKYDLLIDPSEETLIMVDLFGGSPYNAAAQVAFNKENIEIVTGLNLPILLEVLASRQNTSLKDIKEIIKDNYSGGLVLYSDLMLQFDSDDLEEDEL